MFENRISRVAGSTWSRLCLVLLSGLLPLIASAERNLFNNPNNKAYFGVRAALDMTCPRTFRQTNLHDRISLTQDYLGSRSGVSVGAVFNMPIIANLYFEPGVSFFFNTLSVRYDLRDALPDHILDNISAAAKSDRQIKQWGMRIPLDLGYQFDFHRNFALSVFTGPVLNIGFSMKGCMGFKLDNAVFYSGSSLYSTGDSERDDRFNRLALGWRAGIGATIRNIYIGANIDFGLTNLYKVAKANRENYSLTHRQNLFQFSLGYDFR